MVLDEWSATRKLSTNGLRDHYPPTDDHTESTWEAVSMVHRKTSKSSKAKTMLRLADLEQSRNAVLHSLGAASSQESYSHAIDEFIGWYCSEPRLSFNRTVVLRYRFFLEQRNLAASTINVRLAAPKCTEKTEVAIAA